MKKLVFVLLMLSMAVPSYGYILVYKLSTTPKGINYVTDSKASIALKGYLILDMTDDDTVADANIILYGKDTDGVKTYTTIHSEEQSDSADLGITWYLEGVYATIDLWCYEDIDFEILGTGKTTEKDVGLGVDDKQTTASSLKGHILAWWSLFFDEVFTIYGSGTASMTLDNKTTKSANDESMTSDEVIDYLLLNVLDDYEEFVVADLT